MTASSAEWLLIRKLLAKRSEPELRKAKNSIAQLFAAHGDETARNYRIASLAKWISPD